MLLLDLSLLITLTFSTPTGDYTNNRVTGEMAIYQQLRIGNPALYALKALASRPNT